LWRDPRLQPACSCSRSSTHASRGAQGQQSEWALLKRHPSEDIFGVQICGGHPDSVARCVQLLDDNIDADFIDINMGCPIDLVRSTSGHPSHSSLNSPKPVTP